MKKFGLMFSCWLVLIFSAWPLAAQKNANPGYEKLKTLAGEWEGKTGDGKPIQVSYRLVSGGTALLETLQPTGEAEMVTLYSPDGERVAVTHYCSVGNQPRMRTAAIVATPAKLDFSFVGGTNLGAPRTGHMRRLVVAFDGDDRFTQTWTWQEKGKDKAETFRFTRKKSA